MEEYLIKNTTREQREQIVKDSLGYSELGCDDAMDGYDMYLPYIEGIKELREITMEYQAQYVRDMEREERGRCNLYSKRCHFSFKKHQNITLKLS